MEPGAASLNLRSDVGAIAERHGLGPRELDALTVFAARVRGSDHGSGVKEKWRNLAVLRLAESLEALDLEQVRAAREAADIGSGAGFPGLALAAALPETRVTLIEQKGKRCEFLRRTVDAMALTNVEILQRLVQLWPEGRERFELVTSRGVLKPPVMVGLGAPLLKVGGTLVLWVPAATDDDVEAEARTVAHRFGLLPAEIVRGENVLLQTYTKRQSPAATAAVGVQPLPHRSSKPRRKSALNVRRCEARIAKISEMIAAFQETRSRAPEGQVAQLDFDIQRLEARRAALVEELERQKALSTLYESPG